MFQAPQHLDPPLYVKLQLQLFVTIQTILNPFCGTELTKSVDFKQVPRFVTFHSVSERTYPMSLLLCELLVKVKESRNGPGVAQTVPGGLGSQNS
jgi:hypothetical protein